MLEWIRKAFAPPAAAATHDLEGVTSSFSCTVVDNNDDSSQSDSPPVSSRKPTDSGEELDGVNDTDQQPPMAVTMRRRRMRAQAAGTMIMTTQLHDRIDLQQAPSSSSSSSSESESERVIYDALSDSDSESESGEEEDDDDDDRGGGDGKLCHECTRCMPLIGAPRIKTRLHCATAFFVVAPPSPQNSGCIADEKGVYWLPMGAQAERINWRQLLLADALSRLATSSEHTTGEYSPKSLLRKLAWLRSSHFHSLIPFRLTVHAIRFAAKASPTIPTATTAQLLLRRQGSSTRDMAQLARILVPQKLRDMCVVECPQPVFKHEMRQSASATTNMMSANLSVVAVASAQSSASHLLTNQSPHQWVLYQCPLPALVVARLMPSLSIAESIKNDAQQFDSLNSDAMVDASSTSLAPISQPNRHEIHLSRAHPLACAMQSQADHFCNRTTGRRRFRACKSGASLCVDAASWEEAKQMHLDVDMMGAFSVADVDQSTLELAFCEEDGAAAATMTTVLAVELIYLDEATDCVLRQHTHQDDNNTSPYQNSLQMV